MESKFYTHKEKQTTEQNEEKTTTTVIGPLFFPGYTIEQKKTIPLKLTQTQKQL